jgi:hypothetical protein
MRDEGKKVNQRTRLTMENQPYGIDKGQIALKEVQPLHEIPLRFPNQIDLHADGKDAIPNKHCRRRDCGENEKKKAFQWQN